MDLEAGIWACVRLPMSESIGPDKDTDPELNAQTQFRNRHKRAVKALSEILTNNLGMFRTLCASLLGVMHFEVKTMYILL